MVASAFLPVASATDSDGTYDQPILFEREPDPVNIVIVPPERSEVLNGNGPQGPVTPCSNTYMEAIRDALSDLDRAVETFGSKELQNVFALNTYEVGCNTSSPSFSDVDIVVATDQTKTVILGVAVFPTNDTCVADSSKAFIADFNYGDMYSVIAQEVGHCLGLAHVGGNHPAEDALDGTYEDTVGVSDSQSDVNCPSNLNVEGLEKVYQTGNADGKVQTSQYENITPPTPPSWVGSVPCGNTG